MAIVKHIKSRNANYSAAINYLLFEHNEKTGKKIVDESGRSILRKEFTWMGFIAAPPLIVHVFIVIGFTSKQDIFTIYQSHVTINSVKTFHCQLLHFFEFYDLIFFDGYSVYQ